MGSGEDRQSPVLVIGYGNPLRGDDGAGPLVAELLRAALEPGRALVLNPHQLTFDLAEPVSRAELVMMIDAAAGGVPGTIACQPVAAETVGAPSLLHSITPGALLATAHALYGRAPRTLLWTVIGTSFDHRQGLSAPVRAAIPELVDRILGAIGEV